jgi:peptidase E
MPKDGTSLARNKQSQASLQEIFRHHKIIAVESGNTSDLSWTMINWMDLSFIVGYFKLLI